MTHGSLVSRNQPLVVATHKSRRKASLVKWSSRPSFYCALYPYRGRGCVAAADVLECLRAQHRRRACHRKATRLQQVGLATAIGANHANQAPAACGNSQTKRKSNQLYPENGATYCGRSSMHGFAGLKPSAQVSHTQALPIGTCCSSLPKDLKPAIFTALIW